jgi:hypothetical protein
MTKTGICVRYESDSADDWEGDLAHFIADNDLSADEAQRIEAALRDDGVYRAVEQGGHVSYTLTVVPDEPLGDEERAHFEGGVLRLP